MRHHEFPGESSVVFARDGAHSYSSGNHCISPLSRNAQKLRILPSLRDYFDHSLPLEFLWYNNRDIKLCFLFQFKLTLEALLVVPY